MSNLFKSFLYRSLIVITKFQLTAFLCITNLVFCGPYNAKNIKFVNYYGECDKQKDYFIAIYDGHESLHVADYLADNLYSNFKKLQNKLDMQGSKYSIGSLLKDSFTTTHESLGFYESLHLGSTAVVVYICKNTIYTANCGDSRAVICIKGNAYNLTSEHKPLRKDEMERITKAGGRIEIKIINKTKSEILNSLNIGTYINLDKILCIGNDKYYSYPKEFDTFQVIGEPEINKLSIVSRAIGYKSLTDLIIPTPEVNKILIDENFEFIILAPAYFWQFVSSCKAVEIIKKAFSENKTTKEASEELRLYVHGNHIKENVSFFILKIK